MWRLLLVVSVVSAWQHYVPPSQRQVEYNSLITNNNTTQHTTTTTSSRRIPRSIVTNDGGLYVFIQDVEDPNADSSNEQQPVLRRLYDQFVGDRIGTGAGGDPNDEVGDGNMDWNQQNSITPPGTNEDTNSTIIDVVSEYSEEVINTTYKDGTATISNSSSVTTRSNSSIYTQYQPLRIRALLTEDNYTASLLSSTERDYLFRELLSPALIAWSQALRVLPVVGNLTVDQQQLSDGETCGPGKDSGLPSVPVPSEHFTIGVPDTDLMIYLSLGKNVAEENVEDDSLLSGGHQLNPTISDAETAPPTTNNDESLWDATNNSTNTTSLICNGDFMAASSFCSTDQFDRPTAAMLHICLTPDFFHPESKDKNILTFMHELGHALGFNELSMAHFRQADGTPLTPRNANGEVPLEQVECTGPSGHRQNATIPLPSSNTVRFRSVRGGVRVAEIVTPSVVQVVRNQFDCQQLTGAELESGEALPLSGVSNTCLGDHWERRLFSTDIMNPIVENMDFTSRISTLTLAYFADSGWYQVDLARSDVAASWGRSAGCSFVDDTCIGSDGQVAPENEAYFCNEVPTQYSRSIAEDIHGCTPDLTRKALCSIGEYDGALPFEYQYFGSTLGSDIGGADPFMDYCPVYTGFSNGLCSSEESEVSLKASSLERFGERNSRCLLGKSTEFEQKTALCMPIACVVEDVSLYIKIDGRWRQCKETGEQLKTSDPNKHVICPDARRVCPTFYCSYDCLGTEGGICDYNSGKCLCPKQIENQGHDTGVVYQVCSDEEHSDDGTPQNNKSPFLRPTQGNDAGMPDPDSPLADYYVVTTDDLRNDDLRLIESWLVSLIALAGVLTAMIVVYVVVKRRQRGEEWNSWFINGGESDQGGTGVVIDPQLQKQKGVAHALWELRIQHPQLDEETDCRLTASDVARSSLASQYSRQSSDPNFSSSEMGLDNSQIEDLEEVDAIGSSQGGDGIIQSPSPPSSPPHAVIRRRTGAAWNDPCHNEF